MPVPLFFTLDNCQLTLLERCCWLLVSAAATQCSHGFWLLLSVWLRGVLTLFLTPLKDVLLRSDFSVVANRVEMEFRRCGSFELESKVYICRPHSVNSWWKWCGSREREGAFCLSAVCWHIIEVPLALWQLRSQSLLFCWDTANWTRWVSPPLWLDTMLLLFFCFFTHTVFQSVCLNVRVSLYA